MSPAAFLLLLPLLSAVVIQLLLKRNATISALVSVASSIVCLGISISLLLGHAPDSVVLLFNWIDIGSLALEVALPHICPGPGIAPINGLLKPSR